MNISSRYGLFLLRNKSITERSLSIIYGCCEDLGLNCFVVDSTDEIDNITNSNDILYSIVRDIDFDAICCSVVSVNIQRHILKDVIEYNYNINRYIYTILVSKDGVQEALRLNRLTVTDYLTSFMDNVEVNLMLNPRTLQDYDIVKRRMLLDKLYKTLLEQWISYTSNNIDVNLHSKYTHGILSNTTISREIPCLCDIILVLSDKYSRGL